MANYNHIVQWCVDVCKEWSTDHDLQEVSNLYDAWCYFKLVVKSNIVTSGDLYTLNCHFNPLIKFDDTLNLVADPFTQPREAFEEYVRRSKYKDVNPYLIACLLVNASAIDTPVVFRKHMFAN